MYLKNDVSGDIGEFTNPQEGFSIPTQEEITALQRGSAQPHVYPKDIIRLLIVDAPEKLIIEFEEISKSIFNEIRNLKLKNANLRQTRDLLLPKLISGQVDVSEMDIETGDIK